MVELNMKEGPEPFITPNQPSRNIAVGNSSFGGAENEFPRLLATQTSLPGLSVKEIESKLLPWIIWRVNKTTLRSPVTLLV